MSQPDRTCRNCPPCSSRDSTIIARVSAEQIVTSSPFCSDASDQRLGVSPDATYGLAQCQRCQLAFASAVPSDESLKRLYGAEHVTRNAVRVFARPGRAAYAFRALSRLLEAIATRTELNQQGATDHRIGTLDVGCAYGVGSTGLIGQHYPYDVTGMEWSRSTRNYLARNGMAPYRTVEDIPAGTVSDGIPLSDLLEHLPDPVDLVRCLGIIPSCT